MLIHVVELASMASYKRIAASHRYSLLHLYDELVIEGSQPYINCKWNGPKGRCRYDQFINLFLRLNNSEFVLINIQS